MYFNKNDFNKINDYWIWLDMEMTGLNPEVDYILEIAIVITDYDLNIVAELPDIVINQSDKILSSMDDWNKRNHSKNGLIEKVRQSNINEKQAEEILLQFLSNYILPKRSPLCGNSICQDRRFMFTYMPILESFFHYRNIDVSSIKELLKAWCPKLSTGFIKKNQHSALSDIYESIQELRFYKKNFFSIN